MKTFYFSILFITSYPNNLEVYYSKVSNNINGPPAPRSQVILTADKYARVHWLIAKANLIGIGCGKSYTSDYPIGDRVGMGYKFRGWDSIDTFLAKIAKGYGTVTGIDILIKI